MRKFVSGKANLKKLIRMQHKKTEVKFPKIEITGLNEKKKKKANVLNKIISKASSLTDKYAYINARIV